MVKVETAFTNMTVEKTKFDTVIVKTAAMTGGVIRIVYSTDDFIEKYKQLISSNSNLLEYFAEDLNKHFLVQNFKPISV